MDSPLISIESTPPASGVIEYAPLMFNYNDQWQTTRNARTESVMPVGGTIKWWKAKLSSAPGSGDSRTFTIVKNGVETSATLTLSGSTREARWTGEISFSSNDKLCVKGTASGTPSATNIRWYMLFVHSSYSVLIGNTKDVVLPLDRYFGVQGTCQVETASSTMCVIPTNITLQNLQVYLDTAPGSSKSRTFTLCNNGVATSYQVTISDTNTEAEYNATTLSVSAGDYLEFKATATGVAANCYVSWGMSYEPSVDGESVLTAPAEDAVSTVGKRCLFGWDTFSNFTPSYSSVPSCVFKKIYVYTDTAPGAGKNFLCRLEQYTTNTIVECDLADVNTSANETTKEFVPISEDSSTLHFEVVPYNTPSLGRMTLGIVCYMNPTNNGLIFLKN